jgi:two-component system response regulator RpaA
VQQQITLDATDEALELADLIVYPSRCQAVRRNRHVRLGDKECRVLVMLLRANGRVVSIPDLMCATWGKDDPTSAAKVRGVVQRLRAKLRTPNLILTIGGEGYCVELPTRPASD